jgi:hypothetical protein
VSNTFLKDDFPRACELCEKELKEKKALKHHMKTHSYKYVGLKCNDCSYLAEEEIDMLVHVGKKHSDHFECCLCDLVEKDKETLGNHLYNCEVYQSQSCDKLYKHISDLKTYCLSEYIDKRLNYRNLRHIKQSRENPETFDFKSYKFKDHET